MTDPEPNTRDDGTLEPPAGAPTREFHETAAPTRDYLETPGLHGPTQDVRRSPGGGVRHAPLIPGFEILEELGRGGMGVVYKARQIGLKRIVALKMIRARCADSRALARFRAEAAAAARLQHPNIVQVYEIGEQEGEPYFALEFLIGGSLAQRLDKNPQPARASAELIETIARAVHLAHEKGIVHRDLKPANILLDAAQSDSSRTLDHSSPSTAGSARGSNSGSQSGSLRSTDLSAPGVWGRATPKIADFGIAKQLTGEDDEPAALRTETGAILGTPSYMAPEQAAGRSDLVGPTTDVYALGAILYELLTGKAPFQAPTAIETVHMVLTQEPTAPRKFAARTPHDLETICLKCLEKTRERRYHSAVELADDLRRFLDGEPILARPATTLDRLAKWTRKRPALAAALVGGSLAVFAASAVGAWAWDTYFRTKTEHYHTFVMLSGRPVAVGKLTPEQAARRMLSYRLTRTGSRVEAVEFVNGLGYLSAANPFFNTATILGDDDEQDREAFYTFHADESGNLLQTIARNSSGDFLWRLNFTPPDLANYTDLRGFPKARTASGAGYVQFAEDAEGGTKILRYLDRNGVPRCSSTKVFAARMKFDERGLLQAIDYLGPKDEPTLHRQGMARVEVKYDDRGLLTDLAALDEHGKPVMIDIGFSSAKLFYDDVGNCVRLVHLGLDGQPRRSSNGFAAVTSKYDERGRQVLLMYEGADGKPVLNTSAVAGERHKFDEHGWVVEVNYLGVDGRPTLNRYGVASARYKYDDLGRLLSEWFVDLDGKPTWPSSGKAGVAYKYDKQGHVSQTTTLGLDGQPTPGTDGYATSVSEFDAAGNVVRAYYLDVAGQRMRHSDGEYEITYKYDDYGKNIEEAYRDADGKLVLTSVGCARVEMKYDDDGNVIEWIRWDANGAPARDADGAHRVVAEYDVRRNQIGYRAFGVDGKPTMTSDGYSSWKAVYDTSGNAIKRSYFDLAGRPCLSGLGHASQEIDYDERNNQTEVRNFGVDGLLLGQGAVAKTIYERDEIGQKTAETHFDAAGRPVTDENGCHRTTFKYDPRGLEIERCYFGADGEPTPFSSVGNSIWRRRYDSLGRMIEESFFDAQGRPVDTSDGFAARRQTFNEWGQVIAIQYFEAGLGDAPPRSMYVVQQGFDTAGNEIEWAVFTPGGEPTTWGEAWHRLTYRYDGLNRRIERRQFGVDGKPLAHPEAAIIRYENDDLGRAVAVSNFDAQEQPIENAVSVHREEKVYDHAGHEVERRYFNAAGKPARYGNVGNSIWRRQFDALGRIVEESFYDGEGQPMNLVGSGYATVRYVRDAWGNPIEKRYYDADDEPTGGIDGIFTLYSKYDVRGYWTSLWAEDVAGKPALLSSGVYRRDREVDARGNALWSASYDGAGKPMATSESVHREESVYDLAGREIERRYFGVDLKPAKFGAAGNSMWRKKYDSLGRVIEESYYDADGKLMNTEGGLYAICRYVRDTWGNAIETRYYDVADKPTGGNDGIFVIYAKYDLRGRWISMRAADVDEKPVIISGGSYRRDRDLDDVGNVLRQSFFDAEGRPMLCARGLHIEEADYDDEGRPIDSRWFDVEGKPLPTVTVVTEVSSDGVGAEIGLQVGDVIVAYDGEPIGNRDRLLARRRQEQPGDPKRRLEWRRGEQTLSAEVGPGILGVSLQLQLPQLPKKDDAPPAI